MEAKPWLVPASIPAIEKLFSPAMRVIEFGCGGSTLWFAKHIKKNGLLVSVEHDREWWEKTKKACPIKNDVSYCFILRDQNEYSAQASMYDDNTFDIALIDGRRRCDCMIATAPKVKIGGYMILDNSERADYKPGIDFILAHGFKKVNDWVSNDAWPYVGWTTTLYKKIK